MMELIDRQREALERLLADSQADSKTREVRLRDAMGATAAVVESLADQFQHGLQLAAAQVAIGDALNQMAQRQEV